MSKDNKSVVDCDYSQPLPTDANGHVFKTIPIIEQKIIAQLPKGVSTIPGGFDPKNLSWLGGQKMQYNANADPNEWEQGEGLKFEVPSPSLPECLAILDDWKRQLEQGPLKVEETDVDDGIVVMDEKGKLWQVNGLQLIASSTDGEQGGLEEQVSFSIGTDHPGLGAFAKLMLKNLSVGEGVPEPASDDQSVRFDVTGDNGLVWTAGYHVKGIDLSSFNAILANEANFVIIATNGVEFKVGEYITLYPNGSNALKNKIDCMIKHVSNYGLLPKYVILRLEKTLSADELLENAKKKMLEKEIISSIINYVNVDTAAGIHALKTDPAIFQAVKSGKQTFEIRLNDRDYKVGEVLVLRETVFTGEEMAAGAELEYTGEHLVRRITYVLSGYGLKEDWVILGTEEYEDDVR